MYRHPLALLPDWARPSHAVLRYMLQRGVRQRTRLQRGLVRAAALAIVAGLLVSSYAMVLQDDPLLMGDPLHYPVLTVLYFPLVMLQFVGMLIATLLTMQAISAELDRGTWDDFRLTSHGAALVFRARWAAVFYQLRWLLAALTLPRVIAAALLIADAAGTQGHAIDLYTSGITPALPVGVAVLLLAALVTAALLLVPVMIGFYAALGLLVAALVRQRTLLVLLRIALPGLMFMLWVAGLNSGAMVLDADPLTGATLSTPDRWGALLLLYAGGDAGLRALDLPTTLASWVQVDYAVLIGAALLGITLALGLLTDMMVRFAAWYASRPARA